MPTRRLLGPRGEQHGGHTRPGPSRLPRTLNWLAAASVPAICKRRQSPQRTRGARPSPDDQHKQEDRDQGPHDGVWVPCS